MWRGRHRPADVARALVAQAAALACLEASAAPVLSSLSAHPIFMQCIQQDWAISSLAQLNRLELLTYSKIGASARAMRWAPGDRRRRP